MQNYADAKTAVIEEILARARNSAEASREGLPCNAMAENRNAEG